MYVGLITAGNQKLSLILVVELLDYLVLYAWTDVPRYGPVEIKKLPWQVLLLVYFNLQ